MGGHAGKANFRGGGVKVLIDDLPELAAVDGPGKIDGKTREIQRFCTAQAHFLIRHKRHHDIAVAVLWRQVLQYRHHYRHGGFVIRPEHAGTVAKNNLFIGISEDFGMLSDAQPDLFFSVQTEVFTSKTQDLWMNIRRQPDVNGIDMGNKANPRRACDIASFHRRDGSVLVDHNLIQPQLA